MQVQPYLFFNGNCEEAFKFYERSLGGKILAMMRHAGSPMEQHTPPEWRDKIMHARLSVDDTVLLGSDSPPEHYKKPQGFSVCIEVKELARAQSAFKALSEGGSVGMDFQKTFWALGFGMLVDRYGTHWMINCPAPMS